MKQWEYLIAQADLSHGHVWEANGKRLESRPKLSDYWSKLGHEGWELVAVWSCGGGTSSGILFFKRPSRDD
jgi:hypothetical protein